MSLAKSYVGPFQVRTANYEKCFMTDLKAIIQNLIVKFESTGDISWKYFLNGLESCCDSQD